MALLDNGKLREDFLTLVRKTGQYKDALDALGIDRSTMTRYCQKHPEFEQDCQLARAYYKAKKKSQFNGKIIDLALQELEKRLESGKLSDMALLKVLGYQ